MGSENAPVAPEEARRGASPSHRNEAAREPVTSLTAVHIKKILIVDDSATMRKIIMRSLRQAGISVEEILEAANGLEGLEVLAAAPDVDLVLSDINMPEMDGITFVKNVREKHTKAELPMVMITTEGGEAALKDAPE